jgi:hypothetical protein
MEKVLKADKLQWATVMLKSSSGLIYSKPVLVYGNARKILVGLTEDEYSFVEKIETIISFQGALNNAELGDLHQETYSLENITNLFCAINNINKINLSNKGSILNLMIRIIVEWWIKLLEIPLDKNVIKHQAGLERFRKYYTQLIRVLMYRSLDPSFIIDSNNSALLWAIQKAEIRALIPTNAKISVKDGNIDVQDADGKTERLIGPQVIPKSNLMIDAIFYECKLRKSDQLRNISNCGNHCFNKIRLGSYKDFISFYFNNNEAIFDEEHTHFPLDLSESLKNSVNSFQRDRSYNYLFELGIGVELIRQKSYFEKDQFDPRLYN